MAHNYSSSAANSSNIIGSPLISPSYSLNQQQQQASDSLANYTLVLAGPGTGKTTVLLARTHKLIMQNKVHPSNILLITFTNKAALELKKRLYLILPKELASQIYVGTFHSFAAKILMQHYNNLSSANYGPRNKAFTLLDEVESFHLFRDTCQKQCGVTKASDIHNLWEYVQKLKDNLNVEGKAELNFQDEDKYADYLLQQVYQSYQNKLKSLNALDFGDLVPSLLLLLRENSELCTYYQKKFLHILVDEYQDTSKSQYALLRVLLQRPWNNLFCVGDENQTIYGWRGVNVENILNFAREFPNAAVIALKQNYRSGPNIVELANSLIKHNKERYSEINLESAKNCSIKPKLHIFNDEKQEALAICGLIQEKIQQQVDKPHSIAILTRNGLQLHYFQEQLNNLGIEYNSGNINKLYSCKAVKDLLAYINAALRTCQEEAFLRVITTPARGIGKKSLEYLRDIARTHQISLYRAAELLCGDNARLTLQPQQNQQLTFIIPILQIILSKLEKWHNYFHSYTENSLKNWCIMLIDESEYVPHLTDGICANFAQLEKNYTALNNDHKKKAQNIFLLLKQLDNFSNKAEFTNFVYEISQNNPNRETQHLMRTATQSINNNVTVSLTTIHSAKGMEFNTVFVPCWEEGLLPSNQSIKNNPRQLEEERRIAYVGLTRAIDELHISYACNRFFFGTYRTTQPSRFLFEISTKNYIIMRYN